MKRAMVTMFVALATLGGTVLAQSAAPAPTYSDPVVQRRADQRAANAAYDKGVKAARAERDKKVSATVDAAVAEAKANGKDPLVARRDARARAMRETKPEFDAQVKALAAERRAALDAAAKNAKPATK